MEFSRNFRFLTVINGNLVSMEFNGFLRRRVDFGKNLRLMDLSGFPGLWFGVKAIYYRVFLFIWGAVNKSFRLSQLITTLYNFI